MKASYETETSHNCIIVGITPRYWGVTTTKTTAK